MKLPLDAMVTLVDALVGPVVAASDIIAWASPVPYFGRLPESHVATVGINPSNLEFVDCAGSPLRLTARRLPTLGSLGLERWSRSDRATAEQLLHGCSGYFERNPYRHWFDALDRMLAPSGYSYYPDTLSGGTACHVDVVPYATKTKWGALTSAQRGALLALGLDVTAHFIRESPVTLLLLNGSSVAALLRPHLGQLDSRAMPTWNLPRKDKAVPGTAYIGVTHHLAGIDLGRQVRVLGWNHNVQSSFGVTASVKHAIAGWITAEGAE